MDSSKNDNADATSVSRNEGEIICLDESTSDDIPASLKNLFSYPSNVTNHNAIFTSILLVVSVESGFTWNVVNDIPLIQRNYSFDIERLRSIIPESCPKWNDQNFQVTLYLGSAEIFKCRLVVIPWSDKLIVQIDHSELLLCFSSIFLVSQYVENKIPKYESLRDLSIKLKNELFYPLKSYILTNGSVANPSLTGVPIEIIIIIAQYLQIKDYLNLCASCKLMHEKVGDNEFIWANFCKSFGLLTKPEEETWKSFYIQSAKVDKKRALYK